MISMPLLSVLLQAGSASQDILLKEGRMYSVLAVLMVIFAALIAYMIVTERRVRSVERKLEE